jgi:hypothetical protein
MSTVRPKQCVCKLDCVYQPFLPLLDPAETQGKKERSKDPRKEGKKQRPKERRKEAKTQAELFLNREEVD